MAREVAFTRLFEIRKLHETKTAALLGMLAAVVTLAAWLPAPDLQGQTVQRFHVVCMLNSSGYQVNFDYQWYYKGEEGSEESMTLGDQRIVSLWVPISQGDESSINTLKISYDSDMSEHVDRRTTVVYGQPSAAKEDCRGQLKTWAFVRDGDAGNYIKLVRDDQG